MKYKEEVVSLILNLIKGGTPNKYAAQASGVDESTFYDWVKNKPKFSESLKKAEGERIASLVLKIRKDTAWTSAAWILERLDRNLFSAQNVKEVNDRIGKIEEALAKKGLL